MRHILVFYLVVSTTTNDLKEELTENDTILDEGNSNIGGSDVGDDFLKLLEEVQKELYLFCTSFLSLNFTANMLHIKVNNK